LQTNKIQDNPLERGYLEVLISLKRDVEILINTLEQQRSVLAPLTHSIQEGEAKRLPAQDANKLSGNGYIVRASELSLTATEEALQSFMEMSKRMSELESWVMFLHLFFTARG
jgi:hypothetical protein